MTKQTFHRTCAVFGKNSVCFDIQYSWLVSNIDYHMDNAYITGHRMFKRQWINTSSDY